MEKAKIDIIDLFSGYGGFSLGFQQAGFEVSGHYFSEIDPHAIACYKNNFPHAKFLGSVTEQSGWEFRRENPLVITFGSPCQDFSLAGKRSGMGGERSSLIEHAILLIERLQPDFFVWENVKGVFSSNAGADFWAIIQAFTGLGPYRLEWELVNSSWWIPQNRERVYLVGHLAKPGRSFREVFPIGECDAGIVKGATEAPVVRTLTAGGHSGGYHIGMTLIQEVEIGSFRMYNDGNGFRKMESGLSPTLTARARQDGSNQPIIKVKQVNPSTESGGKQPYQQNRIYDAEGISPAIDRGAGRWSVKAIITPDRPEKRQNGRRIKDEGEPAHTLTAQDRHGVVLEGEEYIAIRRLTEIECERLQGLPDDWTRWGMYENKKTGKLEKKEISATQRYKMCGNGVTVNVVQAIAEKLKMYFSE